MNKTLHTKFGTAKVNKRGYYMITSAKEGNNGKLLHRLIFADYWQINDINEFFGEKMAIHHIDGNKINNELNNLEPIPEAEHHSLHNKGVNHKGENNPRAKYGKLWDIESVQYNPGSMFQYGREPNPCKCFQLKYKGKNIPMGYFHDFKTVEIVNDLISSIIDEEEQKRS